MKLIYASIKILMIDHKKLADNQELEYNQELVDNQELEYNQKLVDNQEHLELEWVNKLTFHLLLKFLLSKYLNRNQ